MFQIFDKFLPRLQDPNSKVNLYALQVMLQVVPKLNDSLGAVINIAVGNISPNLSSKNKEINQAAIDIIDALIEHMGNYYIQFCIHFHLRFMYLTMSSFDSSLKFFLL